MAAAGPASAHHSFGRFDMQKTVAITGTVKEFVWANPHSWLYVIVPKKNGGSEEWAFECSSPNMMIRWGWHAADIKPGDRITIDTHPARDGQLLGATFAVYLPNGKVLADPMGRTVRSEAFAEAPPAVPSKPTGVPYN
jgi:hypothetical protein